MQDNYYNQLINQIKESIQEEKYQTAHELIEAELKMPYVPQEVEKQLILLQREVAGSVRQASTGKKILTEDQLEEYLLNGSETQQLQAIEDISNRNLRDYFELVTNYLAKGPARIFASLLITACIEQQIRQEIKYNIDGLEITFIPSTLEKPVDTDGFKLALEQLTEWFENDNPSFLVLCIELLIREVYLILPEAYEAEEAELLAFSIAAKVYQLLSDEEGLRQFLDQHNFKKEQMIVLYS